MNDICYLCLHCWAMNDPSKPSTFCKHFKATAKPKPKIKRKPQARYEYEIKIRENRGEELYHYDLNDQGIAEAVAHIKDLDWDATEIDEEGDEVYLNEVELNIWDNKEHDLDWAYISHEMSIGKRAQKMVNKFIALMQANNLDIH